MRPGPFGSLTFFERFSKSFPPLSPYSAPSIVSRPSNPVRRSSTFFSFSPFSRSRHLFPWRRPRSYKFLIFFTSPPLSSASSWFFSSEAFSQGGPFLLAALADVPSRGVFVFQPGLNAGPPQVKSASWVAFLNFPTLFSACPSCRRRQGCRLFGLVSSKWRVGVSDFVF